MDSNPPPPPYEFVAQQQQALDKAASTTGSGLVAGADPRTSSQHSLGPESSSQDERKKLLLVYVHGFMGNETSFRSFPAHVHNLLTVLLAETREVHTKIYPRYRSRDNIIVAREDLSRWLQPHESSSTDTVLLGHSMGGLLTAEVVLMPPPLPASRPLKHRILGTINFDVPFLGMHPGVVKSGLSSIFLPAEETHQDHYENTPASGADPSRSPPTPPRADTLYEPDCGDPNFNPTFANDVILPTRKGWQNAWHFISKHSNDLVNSTKKLVSSHLEFGGAMANYAELKLRYSRIRALEEEDGRVRQSAVGSGPPARVRFINYYTASTGRPKAHHSASHKTSSEEHDSRSPAQAPASYQSSVSDVTGSASINEPSSMPQLGARSTDLSDAIETSTSFTSDADPASEPKLAMDDLPALPELPAQPPPLGDLSYIQDKETRKLVEKEHERAVKLYQKAIKDRHKVLKDRAKLKEKRRREEQKLAAKAASSQQQEVSRGKQAALPAKPESEMSHSEREELRLQRERLRMEAEARRLRGEPDPQLESSELVDAQSARSVNPSSSFSSTAPSMADSTDPTQLSPSNRLTPSPSAGSAPAAAPVPPPLPQRKKEGNFCMLPPKDSNGERDPCWVRVLMENVDEVGAHCGLFFVDERYERLVGDVAETIETWIRRDEEHGNVRKG